MTVTPGLRVFAATAMPAVEPATADRHDQRVDRGLRRKHLERHGSLARDDVGIIERMNEDAAAGPRELPGVLAGGVERLPMQHDLGPMRSCLLNLHVGREKRHDNGRWNVESHGVAGNGLAVIAGGHCHDARGGAPSNRAAAGN